LFSILAAGDLNGDGNDDIVLAARYGGNSSVGGQNEVIVLLYDPKAKNFAVNQAIQEALDYSL